MLKLEFSGQERMEKSFEAISSMLAAAKAADDKISDRTSQLIDLDHRIIVVTHSEKRQEAAMMAEVSAEVDPDNTAKRRFTNAEMRKAEVARRMADNEATRELAELTKERVHVEAEVRAAERELRHLERASAFHHARIAYGTAMLIAFGQK